MKLKWSDRHAFREAVVEDRKARKREKKMIKQLRKTGVGRKKRLWR